MPLKIEIHAFAFFYAWHLIYWHMYFYVLYFALGANKEEKIEKPYAFKVNTWRVWLLLLLLLGQHYHSLSINKKKGPANWRFDIVLQPEREARDILERNSNNLVNVNVSQSANSKAKHK